MKETLVIFTFFLLVCLSACRNQVDNRETNADFTPFASSHVLCTPYTKKPIATGPLYEAFTKSRSDFQRVADGCNNILIIDDCITYYYNKESHSFVAQDINASEISLDKESSAAIDNLIAEFPGLSITIEPGGFVCSDNHYLRFDLLIQSSIDYGEVDGEMLFYVCSNLEYYCLGDNWYYDYYLAPSHTSTP